MKHILLIGLNLTFIIAMAQKNQITDNVLITDRPDQTESPNAVGKGVIQIETGLLFQRYKFNEQISVHRTVYPTSLFRIGLIKRLELRVVNEVVSYKTINNTRNEQLGKLHGTENMQLGLKYQLTANNSKTMIGIMAHAILPTGSEGISNKRYGIFSRLNIAHSLSENKSVSVNLGYDNYELELTDKGFVRYSKGNLTYTLVYGVALNDRVGIYAEVFGNYLEFETWEVNMDAGLTYLLSDQVQLDYSYGWGIDNIMNYHSIGISIRLPE